MEVPPKKKYLSKVRNFVREVSEKEYPLSEEKLGNLVLCISEAVANSIKEHRNIKCSESIVVKLNLFSNRIEAKVTDKGNGFDPQEFTPTFSKRELEEQGMGLNLIKALSDECTIKSSSKGTSVRVCIFG